MMKSMTTTTLLALSALATMSCNPTLVPPGSPDDVARFTDGLIRFTETVNPGAEETTSEQLESAEEFAERVYYDCQQTSAHPPGQLGVRKPFDSCPAWDADTLGPAMPRTCAEAVCAALVSECVAENLYAISREVQDFESSKYTPPPPPLGGSAKPVQFAVPPQLAAAKATLVEVASTWAARSIQISGENLRRGLGVARRNGITYQAACTPGTSGRDALFKRGNTLSDVLGNSDVSSSWAEVFLSTLAHVSDFQTTLASGIEQSFSAVAEAQQSRNTSASVAARFGWVEGRTSRARAAHALIGGDREGGLFRVPKGYGSLGRLNSTERQALGEIRGVGIDPAVLSGTAVDIVNAVVAARRAQAHLPDADFTSADLLANQGLTEADFLRAARWLDDAITIFGMNRSVKLPTEPEIPDRFAATSSFEVVPPTVDLLTGARRGTLPVTSDFAWSNRMLDASYPLRNTAASIDYAADVMDELAPLASAMPVDLRPAWNEVFESAAGSVMDQRTGRVEFCSPPFLFLDVFGGQLTPSVRYAGEAQDVAAVRSLDGLRCALTGTIHGAPCDLQDWLLASQPVVAEHEAGVDRVHIWSAPNANEPVYVLEEQREGDRVVAYHPIAGGHFPPMKLVQFRKFFFFVPACSLVPVVPVIDQAAAHLLTPDVQTFDRAATSCAGIPADQRLPLEDELTDDGDRFESSWRHYLTLAEDSSAEADRLGQAVIENGLEIERRVELASANLQGVCGEGVDVDFLSNLGAADDPSLCLDEDGGTEVAEGVGESARGFVCRNGRAVPDAMATVRARAADGDPNAQKVLDCVGDESVVRWASLGSHPLCLWEDDSGAACVGAYETGQKCPVVKQSETDDCSMQLAEAMAAVAPYGTGLHAVDVDQNLGVFADTIRAGPRTSDRRDDGPTTPPCENLRLIRSETAIQAEKQGAMESLLDGVWLSQATVSAQARRLTWQAEPYDYGVVTRDAEARWWTGDPSRGSYPTERWPCGQPIAEGLLGASGSCAGSATGTSHAGPLGCSFVSDCSANGPTGTGPLLERIRMNQRVGRAVVALRLLTAAGFEGMALPMNITTVDGGSVDRYSFRGGPGDESLFLPQGFTDATGRVLPSLPMSDLIDIEGLLAPKVRATEVRILDRNRTRDGNGYCARVASCEPGHACSLACVSGGDMATAVGGCSAANMGYLWTAMDQATYFGLSECSASCLRNNNCSNCFRVFSPCFDGHLRAADERRAPFLARRYSGEDAQPPAGAAVKATLDVWPGVGPSAAAGDVGVITDTLNHFVTGGDANQVVAGFEERDYFRKYFRGSNNIRLMEDLTYGDVMDALELACASAEADLAPTTSAGAGGVSNDACSPDRLANLEASPSADIAQLEEHMRCSAKLVEDNAQLLVVRNLPQDVVNSVKASFGGATIPELSGSRGVLVGEITADIIELRNQRIRLADTMDQLGSQIFTLRTDLDRAGIQRDRLRIGLSRDIANQITSCLVASSPSVTAGVPPSGSANPGAAIATCANTARQIALAVADTSKALDLTRLDVKTAYDRFNLAYQGLGRTLGEIEVALAAAGQRLQSRSAELATGRNTAKLALGQAMLFSSDGAGRQLRVNTLLRRRFTTSQGRYERARIHAMQMAYLAKLAVEQRLGVRLADLRNDMTLVSAPASWESTLCTMTGMDFAQIRDGDNSQYESYANQFIGDYVDRLQRTVESYRLDFPFHEGSDTAIMSMRDVLLNVRDECPDGVDVPNLVADSADLSTASWSRESCVSVEVATGPDGLPIEEVRNCLLLDRSVVAATATEEGTPLNLPSSTFLGSAMPWRARFGPAEDGGLTSATIDTRLTQVIPGVESGTHMISWFGADVDGSPLSVNSAVSVELDGVPVSLSVERQGIYGGTCDLAAHNGWCRYYSLVEVPRASDVTIAIEPNTAVAVDGFITGPQAVELGGIQFEDLSTEIRHGAAAAGLHPTAFFETDQNARSSIPVCEDTDGDVFRSGWRYDCDRLCSTGFRTDCDESEAVLRCYWERQFSLASEDLLARGQLGRAGFAVGNYNYRMDRLALNFVGTGVRDCEGSPFPSTCYGSGYVNYSLEHLGPYTVINHQGDEYRAPLFIGNIEHARGLSVERYLTNPLSSADRGLIEPYSRGEFRGRPLTGTYVVRIWDDGNVNFNAIEDVQILLDYRYWTRFR